MSINLLIDIGNSRIKWAYDDGAILKHHGSAVHGGAVPHDAALAWRNGPVPARVLAANVAGESCAARLNEWLIDEWQLKAEFVSVDPACAIVPAYAQPQHFGVDRWLALVAARRLQPGMLAVIDAGTAVTIDILAAQAQHLGGVIMPGLELMSQTLLQKSAAIQHGIDAAKNSAPALLGNDTRSCVEKGALYAIAGALEHLLHKLEAQTGEAASVIICGGDAERVMHELDRACQHVPDLVLQGIQRLKGDDKK